MLSISGLSVNYGPVHALADVSLEVPRGEVTAVIGANGAGKSTLMRTLAGLVKPAAGSASLDGVQITGKKAEDVVRMGGMWRSKNERAGLHAQFYDLFPVLGERRKMRADTLSGGERQQLAIGRALMCGPQCLLLDEPSLGLAPLIVTQILELVKQLATEANIAVLLVEQNAVTALRVANTAVVLNLGQVVMSGSASDIASHEELRHAYLGY
jgi:branched-chain amino acid transport system ATP-binding protein